MSDVTDADRERAARIVGSESPWRDMIAAALAEERAKARAETMDFVLDQISKGATFGRFEVTE